ncbi:MAG: DUF3892 domain-containing protein [Armatimonadia bacterium]|nr:DUF3892 domain-containing protein [Armatimonadia bacterium]
MARWADWVITAVRYDPEDSHIEYVQARRHKGDTLGEPTRQSRATVVAGIGSGQTYVTAYRSDGKWRKGEDVRIIRVSGREYLRTDSNHTPADNLGSLDSF